MGNFLEGVKTKKAHCIKMGERESKSFLLTFICEVQRTLHANSIIVQTDLTVFLRD